ncbi:hypothetical protein MVES_002568 [Malassezia vespertilionis]|uniref:RING-type domain-containing protein n=1 Tax=Malassezia vespertilionis TaxID=2020962 RepID=A0A2N1J9Y8_9BASI|nr:hypothetical protein MVES_002568 [Malassezia vespertilionis]
MSVSMEGADRPRKTHAAHERRKGRRGKKAQHQQSVHARALDPAAPSFEPAAPTQPRFARREGRAPCRDAAKDAAHSPADPNPPKRASAARSRRKFGTKLGTAHAHDAPDMGVAPVLPPDADLRTRQIAALSHNEYDCTICYNTVARKDAVWSCTRCYTVLHLHCVRKWADRSVKQIEERNAMHEDEQIRRTKGSWRCPGCQDVRTAVPTEYRCWCQRSKELLCGDRDPSTAALHIASAWSCGAVCDAPFACGHHTCKKTCHVRAPSTPRCPYDPSVATTCACGRIPVRGRSDCRDPIPSATAENTTYQATLSKRHAAIQELDPDALHACDEPSAQDAVLACTSACTTAQRNAKFASALGLVRDTSKVAYEEELLRFASSERRTANALEEVLADFIQSPRATQLLRAALCQRGVRVNAAVLQTAMLLSRHYGLETETCTEDGVLRMGVLPPSGVGVDVKLRRARHARIPSMVLTEYLDTHPDRAKRAAAARLATRTAQPAPCNAVQIVPVPAHLRGALDAVLAPATLGGRRSWRLVQTEDAAFLTDITLESLSLAAVASSAAPPAYATLSPRERRLGGLVDELNAVLGGAMQAVLVAYEAGRVERVCRGA